MSRKRTDQHGNSTNSDRKKERSQKSNLNKLIKKIDFDFSGGMINDAEDRLPPETVSLWQRMNSMGVKELRSILEESPNLLAPESTYTSPIFNRIFLVLIVFGLNNELLKFLEEQEILGRLLLDFRPHPYSWQMCACFGFSVHVSSVYPRDGNLDRTILHRCQENFTKVTDRLAKYV